MRLVRMKPRPCCEIDFVSIQLAATVVHCHVPIILANSDRENGDQCLSLPSRPMFQHLILTPTQPPGRTASKGLAGAGMPRMRYK